MRRRCSIRLFLSGVLAALALGAVAGFFAGTQKRWQAYEERIALLKEQNEEFRAQQAEEGPAREEAAESIQMVEPYAYVLLAEDGYVTVYLADRETYFSATGIPLERLPEELQREIAEGKFIKGEEELYSFLENYSS